jgi:hypothetical protein
MQAGTTRHVQLHSWRAAATPVLTRRATWWVGGSFTACCRHTLARARATRNPTRSLPVTAATPAPSSLPLRRSPHSRGSSSSSRRERLRTKRRRSGATGAPVQSCFPCVCRSPTLPPLRCLRRLRRLRRLVMRSPRSCSGVGPWHGNRSPPPLPPRSRSRRSFSRRRRRRRLRTRGRSETDRCGLYSIGHRYATAPYRVGERVELVGSHGRWKRPCLQTTPDAVRWCHPSGIPTYALLTVVLGASSAKHIPRRTHQARGVPVRRRH